MPTENAPGSEITPTEQTTTTTVVENAAPENAAPLSQREQIYKKYYEQNNSDNKTTQSEPQSTAAPQVTPPAEVVENEAPANEEQQAVEFLRSMYESNQALARKLEEMETTLANLRSPQQQPAPPPVAAAVADTDPTDWIQALKDGDFVKARELAAQDVLNRIGDNLVTKSIQQSTTLQRVEQDMTSFIQNIRSSNQDLLPFEPYISSVTEQRVKDEMTSKQVTDPTVYAEIYKRVLNEEVDKARKIFGQLRASGKAEATVVQKEILSTSTVTPNAQEQIRGEIEKSEEPKVQSPLDVIRERQRRIAAGKLIV